MSFINIGPAIVDAQYAEFNQDIELNWLSFSALRESNPWRIILQIKFRMLTSPLFHDPSPNAQNG